MKDAHKGFIMKPYGLMLKQEQLFQTKLHIYLYHQKAILGGYLKHHHEKSLDLKLL